MKRIWTSLLAVLLCLSGLPAGGQVAYASPRYQYTLMVYMNGSDLESDTYAATDDILEMIASDYNDTVAVIIETGGTADWHTDEEGLSSISTTRKERYLVKENDIELVDSHVIANMGEASTLEDFLVYGMTHYAADHYGLVMWDHGSGAISGFGADELYDYDSLTIEEMENAFSAAYGITGETLDVVGFDACLMGSLEVAHMLGPYADYMVASEDYEPGHGWSYTALLDALYEGKSGQDLSRAIVDGYVRQAIEMKTDDTITSSVIDLKEVEPLMASLDDMWTALLQGLESEDLKKDIIRARLATESYGQGSQISDDSDMVDLMDYIRQLPEALSLDKAKLMDDLSACVVYATNSLLKPKASGLSVYIPSAGSYGRENASEVYDTMGFSRAYYRFLLAYLKVLDLGSDIDLSYQAKTQSITEENYYQVSHMLSLDDLDADDYNYYMYIQADQLDLIDEVQMVFAMEADLGDMIYLGKDKVGPRNLLDDGTVMGQTLDYWVTLEGHFAPMYYMGSDEAGYIYYYIPIQIEGNDYDLIVLFSKDHPEGYIIGARPYNLHDNGTNIYSRELVQPARGQFITLMYEVDYYNGSFYYYGDWSPLERFRFDGQLDFRWEVIPDGAYGYAFEIRDIYQNAYYSDWILYDYYDTYMMEAGNEYDLIWDVLEGDFEEENGQLIVTDSDSLSQPSTWALDYVEAAMDYGIATEGTTDDYQEAISRGVFCDLVVKMYEQGTGSEIAIGQSDVFSDTEDEAILKAYELGIVNGYLDGTFRPDYEITRQELMTMFYRLLVALEAQGLTIINEPLRFEDLEALSSFAVDATTFMVGQGLVNGTGNNQLSPLGTSTKEVALKIAVGVYDYYLMNE